MKNLTIAPSILSADFANLGQAIQQAEAAGAGYIHVDVMDGQFVPNITIGAPVVQSIRKVTGLTLDIHLMIMQPERYLEAFAKAGGDILTVHLEATTHLHRTVQAIKALGKKAGVAINPATPVTLLEDIIGDVDQVLVMSVNPGFGGQSFIPRALDKLRRCRAMIDGLGLNVELEVDGGITRETAGEAAAAGATVLVAGAAVYGAPDGVGSAIAAIRAAAEAGRARR